MIPLVHFRWVMAFPHLHPFWPAIFLKHRILIILLWKMFWLEHMPCQCLSPGQPQKTITSVPRGPVPERLPPEH